MINYYQKFEIDNLKIEANYSPDVKPCKKIRFTIGKEKAEIDKHDLYALLMLYANEEEQVEATKVDYKNVVMIRKMVKVKTKEAIPAGGEVVFPIEYPVEESIYDKWLEENKQFMLPEGEAKDKLNS